MFLQRSRKRHRKVNLVLACMAFAAILYGTFLTRSGVLADFSVHSFIDLGITGWLVGILGTFIALSIGLLVSTLARKVSVAVGTAIFLWLTFVFVSDLGLMAGTLAFKLRIENLFALSLINPLQVFKMWSLHGIGATLDVLGPAGLYASEELGPKLHLIFAAALGAWVLIPLAVSLSVFSRRSPV